MNSISSSRCNCCELPVGLSTRENCQRCGYPLDPLKEEQFLKDFVQNLERSALYGGEYMSVITLIARYQRRLQDLAEAKVKAAQQRVVRAQQEQWMQTQQFKTPSVPMQTPISTPPVAGPPSQAPVAEASRQPVPPRQVPHQPPARPERMFSLKAFFADQTINIVALLGAFLILIGSVSFIVTTSNLSLSFLVLLSVHLLFGVTGIISYRFKSFRVVSIIYTAIFALQVPLVGYAGYRLVTGNTLQLSPPVLVAVAAIYAAIAYGALAMYQKFEPFAYLALVSLTVADLALCAASGLSYWWWPGMLLLLALFGLLSETHTTTPPRLFAGHSAILRAPIRLCGRVYVAISILAVLPVFLSIQVMPIDEFSNQDARFAFLYLLGLLFCWLCLFVWCTRRTQLLQVAPYLFLVCALAFAYALFFDSIGFALTMIAVAVCYHGLERFAPRFLRSIPLLMPNLEGLALSLIAVLPLVVSPWLFFSIFAMVYGPSVFNPTIRGTALPGVVALLIGLLLSLAVLERHTGLRRQPQSDQRHWCWLLLLSGFVLFWMAGSVVLALSLQPVWGFLGYTLALIIVAVVVRRFAGEGWANPLDILVLASVGLTLLLGGNLAAEVKITLLLSLAALIYGIVLYQRRQNSLWAPFLLALLACQPLQERSSLLLVLSWLLPFLAVGMFHLVLHLSLAPGLRQGQAQQSRAISWLWPLLIIGPLYGALLTFRDIQSGIGVVQSWSHVAFPVALELAVLAGIWYVAAALLRSKRLLFVMFCFAVSALLFPPNSFSVLLALAPALALLALGVSRLAGRDWALPIYALAVIAGVMMGRAGYLYDSAMIAMWGLLAFALLQYLVGVAERDGLITRGLLWSAVGFAAWSIYNAGFLNDYYYPPIIALACSAFGVGIGCVRFLAADHPSHLREKLLVYALPCYTTALIAALFTGLYGITGGPGAINIPFYAAIPDALLLYALIAYGILLFERYPRGLWLVAVFAVWGVLLAVQTTAYYVAALGLLAGLAGLSWSRVTRILFSRAVLPRSLATTIWSWPWYMMSLVAALLVACWSLLPLPMPEPNFLTYCLLAFAGLAYLIGVVEQQLSWTWIGVIFATWSLGEAALRGDIYHLLAVALICTAGGLLTFVLLRFASLLAIPMRKSDRVRYALPFYTVALAAAVWTALLAYLPGGSDRLFPGALSLAMFLYAMLAYSVALCERKATWVWLMVPFALWGTLLLPLHHDCGSSWGIPQLCGSTTFALAGVALACGVVGMLAGLLVGRLIKPQAVGTTPIAILRVKYTWNWPWYLVALLASGGVLLSGPSGDPLGLPGGLFTIGSVLLVLWLAVMLVERMAEFLPVLAVLAVWTLLQTRWEAWQILGVCSLLCVLVTFTAAVWRIRPPAVSVWRPEIVHGMLGIGGQILVVLTVAGLGGLQPGTGMLAHTGAVALALLAFQLFSYSHSWLLQGEIREATRHLCYYSAGLLLSLVVSWEMLAWGRTDLSLLTIPPASYLIVSSPFLTHKRVLPNAARLGQLCSLVGAGLLLGPSLWLSFGPQQLYATLLLAGEALLLFLMGIGLRMRFFVLSGAALVIVSGIHLLFLQELQIPQFLALTATGVILLASATGLLLVRSRIVSWD